MVRTYAYADSIMKSTERETRILGKSIKAVLKGHEIAVDMWTTPKFTSLNVASM